MSQVVLDVCNNGPEFQLQAAHLGLRMIEADQDHVVNESRATEFNRLSGYVPGFVLLGLAELTAGGLANYDSYKRHGALVFEWFATQQDTSFLGNTRAEVILCESRWSARGDNESTIDTEIRDGDNVLLRATSTHAKR